MTQDELDLLLRADVQAWIAAHRDDDPHRLALRHPPAPVAVQQVALLQKAAAKLPSWSRLGCILPPRAYEQATSEELAEAKPFRSGAHALDLTCGLGCDTTEIAKRYDSVVALEPDPVLAAVVRHNLARMGIRNVRLVETRAQDFLATYDGEPFDLIYADPDRRDAAGRRVYALTDCEPDILALLPRLRTLAPRVLIKASPMLDLQAIHQQLPVPAMLWVTSENNECKEILIDIDKDPLGARGAIWLRRGEAYCFIAKPEGTAPGWPPGQLPQYVFEADIALYKAGIAGEWLQAQAAPCRAGMDSPAGFILCDGPWPGFIGNAYRVLLAMEFKPGEVKRQLKVMGIKRVQYTRRDWDLPLAQVQKELGLPEGGSHYLMMMRMGGRRMALLAERVLA